MSTKPTIAEARFADTGGADVLSPPSGLRDSGFVAGTPIVQSYVNELYHQLYLWALYLSDGALAGNHSIGSQLISFADFTFTADSTTDLCAATTHGRSTGDGAVRFANSGGGLPGGLSPATDYWLIVPQGDANHFYVADSLAHALAGVFINISSNGTGTQTLQHQSGTTQVGGLTTAGRIQQAVQTTTVAFRPPGFPADTPDATLPAAIVGQPNPNLSPNGFNVQLGIAAGRTIVGIRAMGTDNGAATSIAVVLLFNDPSTGGTGFGSPPSVSLNDVPGTLSTGSTGTGQLEQVTKTGLSVLIASGVNYYIGVRLLTGAGPTTARVLHLSYDWI
jgi:hypothetical protein